MATKPKPIASALLLALGLFAATALALPAAASPPAPARRPNLVLILVDDAAFMDFGAYGGEARTPNIDRLAAGGALFTSFHSSPLCAPSRAMLLTGIDNHRTGIATIPEVLPREHRGQPGYSMRLEPGVTTVATRLRAAGYRTYMTGKWHLGHGDGDLPADHGFDRSFVLDASGADNWEQKSYMPYYRTADWFEDRERVQLPEDFYSSEFLVDRMIDYLGDAETDAPFFAYVAFQAVHIPVQAPREFTARYEGVFDEGWNVLREARWRRAQTLGLIPKDAGITPMPDRLRAWETLSADERALYAKSMAVYAGMIEAMDHHIGRLIAHVEARGELDDTLFIVTSDNGPEPSHPVGEPGFRPWMMLHGYSRNLETLGERGSYAFIGPEWATAAASPGSLFKFYASEGGLRVPFVVSGPGVVARRVDAPAFVTDVTPTLLDFAGLDPAPADASVPIHGATLRPVLAGDADRVHAPDRPIGIEVSGNAALFRGDYKLVRNQPPWGDGDWRLYDLVRDPGETTDLSASQPDSKARMLADYQDYAAEMGVLELPAGYDIHRQIAVNSIRKQLSYYGWVLALALLLPIALGTWLWRSLRSRRRSVET